MIDLRRFSEPVRLGSPPPGVLPYISNIGMCRPIGRGLLRRVGLKTGLIQFAHFGLESGMVFEGTTECMNVFIVSILNE